MPFYSFKHALGSFLQHDHLPFAQVLPEDTIKRVFEEEGANFGQGEGAIYNAKMVLWAFLSQVLFEGAQRSCQAAVTRIVLFLVTMGRPKCSGNTSAYCRARFKLPVPAIRRLAQEVADGCEAKVPEGWLWKGRNVFLSDGTTVSAPDTPKNQEAYPQANTQKPGLGFPHIRMVVLVSLATAMVADMEMGPYEGKETGETALLRQLLDRLKAGSILLADRYYCSYFMIALLGEHGVDVVTRLHQKRKANFRRGTRLGKGDHIVTWPRPDKKPDWMDEETYNRMPLSMRVRQVLVRVNQPGFRVESFVVATTLKDVDRYDKDDIAELYHRRWLVELDIRSIKSNMGMGILSCKTPDMVRKEIWVYMLAYNLIRQSMLEAALAFGKSPRQLSFTAALQKIGVSYMSIPASGQDLVEAIIEAHLEDLAKQVVGNRPNRVEPRANKRRPKLMALLTKPRAEARAELMAGSAEK